MNDLSKARMQWVRSLTDKKVREREGMFVAEGPKVVDELLAAGFVCELLVSTKPDIYPHGLTITASQLSRISQLQTPQGVLGVFRIPTPQLPADNGLQLLLDEVQDPGNVGTIVRLADWFGVEDIFLTKGCADVWGGKVVQASMGAVARVRVHAVGSAIEVVENFRRRQLPVIATVLGGDNIYKVSLPREGLIVMGNEGRGISQQLIELATHQLTIPNYPPGRSTSESLNVAMATGIVLAEFRRLH